MIKENTYSGISEYYVVTFSYVRMFIFRKIATVLCPCPINEYPKEDEMKQYISRLLKCSVNNINIISFKH